MQHIFSINGMKCFLRKTYFSRVFFSTISSSIIFNKETNSFGFNVAIVSINNASETISNLKEIDHMTMAGFTRSQKNIMEASSTNFPEPGIRFRVCSDRLNCDNALINSSLESPHVLNMKKPQNFSSLINHRIPSLKTKAKLSKWVSLALKIKQK